MNDVVLPIASWFHSAAPALATVAAAFIAVVIAFFTAVARQRRKDLSELLIAARVIESEMRGAKMAILQTIENDNLDLLQEQPSIVNFPATWEQHRGVLAGHLTREQWDVVDLAVHRFEYAMHLTPPGTTQGTAFASIADALGSASTVLEGYASEAGWNDNRSRSKESTQTELVADMPRAATSSPVTEAQPVLAAPTVASINETSPDSSHSTVPPYLLLPAAAVVLSVLVVGVLVSEKSAAVHDLPDAVRSKARQTVATTTNQFQKSASWRGPFQKAASWPRPFQKSASWRGPLQKSASWPRPFQKSTSWRGPLQKSASWQRPLRLKPKPPRLGHVRISGSGIHR